MARFKEGIFINNEETFGVMQFCSLWREKMSQNEDGTVGDEVEERSYDLMCETQGCMVRVGIPADAGEKDFPYEADVVLVNPVVGAIANATYNGADIDWYVKADDIVPVASAPRQQGKADRAGHQPDKDAKASGQGS